MSGNCGRRLVPPMARYLILSRLPERRAGSGADEHDRDVACDHVVGRGRRAFVMHRLQLDAGHVFQQRHVEMAARADAVGAVVDLARLLLASARKSLTLLAGNDGCAINPWLMIIRPLIGVKLL